MKHKIPYNIIMQDGFTLEVYYTVIKLNDKGIKNISVNIVIENSIIVNDKKNKNRKRIRELLNTKSYREVIEFNADTLLLINNSGIKAFVFAGEQEHDKIDNIKVFKYYLYLSFRIKVEHKHYTSSNILNLAYKLKISDASVMTYNKKLIELKLIQTHNFLLYKEDKASLSKTYYMLHSLPDKTKNRIVRNLWHTYKELDYDTVITLDSKQKAIASEKTSRTIKNNIKNNEQKEQ